MATKVAKRSEATSRLMSLLLRPHTPAFAAGAVLFLILFRRSSRFRFVARMTGYIIAVAIACLVGIASAPLMWLIGSPGYINWVVARTFAVVGPLFSGMRYRVIGNENIAKTPLPCVYVANHQSSLDIIGMGAVLPKNTVVLGKKSIRFVPLLGWFMWAANNVFIDRKNRGSAIETMAKVAQYLKEHTYALWLYPEGTRSHQIDNTMLPFKKGAFHLAVQGQIPIVPIVFSTYYPCYHQKKWVFEPGEITIKVLPPIPTVGLKTEDVDALLERTRDAMVEALKTIETKPFGKLPSSATKID
ncbi:1-acylglycerol-3-phosphate O-acyltransferase [Gaertneriomyces sp. JEL0708]|nr:1-acylglycerol-3-phosphate O-acyltransferase [Gaertneriomyces sp. JEL0708]